MKPKMLDKGGIEALKNVAFGGEGGRSATFLVSDIEVLDAYSTSEAVEILPVSVALEKYDWLKALSFSLMSADEDACVKEVSESSDQVGYFIRVKAGAKVQLPVQTCYLLNSDRLTQHAHNIIVAEENSELHLINGCAANAHILSGRHLGVSEYFIKEGALVTTTMIHSWGDSVEVYPRSAAHVGKSAKFVSSYIALSSVKKLQMNPLAIIEDNGLGEFYSVVFAPEKSYFDLGSTAVLNGEGANAQIVSRAVSDGGEVITRGKIIAKKPHVVGSMACNGLLLNEAGSIHAIPELVGENPEVELSHEASVGMISQEVLSYLMAAGIEEARAKSLVIEGFLNLKVPLLPDHLRKQINRLLEQVKRCETI